MKKLRVLTILLASVLCFSRVWVGIGAIAALNGADWRTGAALGLLGVSDSVLYSIAFAGLVSGPAGIAIAAGVGL